MAPANTPECVLEHKGKRVAGVLQGALPAHRADIADGTTTIVFEDGTALSFTGAFWSETPRDVAFAIAKLRQQLEAAQAATGDLLRLAGENVS